MDRVVCIVACLLAAALPAWGQVTGWRGDGTGRYPNSDAPTTWSQTQNVLWSVEVGPGHGSPIVVGNRVFLTAEPTLLACLDRASGKMLWSVNHTADDLPDDVSRAPAHRITDGAGYATQTPASDGQRVYVVFGTGVVAAYDMEGRRLWLRWFDRPQETGHGRSASPLLVGGRLIVQIGHTMALDPKTGKTLWESPDARPLYGSPVAAKVGNVDVAVTSGGDLVRAADGTVLTHGLGSLAYVSPIVHEGMIYLIDGQARAVRLPEKPADSLSPAKLWERTLDGDYYASPVCHEGLLYTVNNNGLFFVLEAATGRTVYEKDLGIGAPANIPGKPTSNMYPSLALVGRHIVVTNDVGVTLVLAPGRTYREVARAMLPEGCGGTMAVSGNQLFIRNGRDLFCIGPKP